MTQIMAAMRFGQVRVVGQSVPLEAGVETDTTHEPLPVEMFWLPKPDCPCGCDDCDEYLWFHHDDPVM